MPEDYQSILDDLGVDTSAPAPAATDLDPQPDDQNATATSTDPAPAAEPASAQADDEAQKRNEAFAALRSDNTKYKKFIQQIMKGANFTGSEEDFMNQLQEASYKRQAQGSQVSPEILKRMDTLESQNKSLIDAQNRQAFAANLRTLQDTLKLEDKDLKEFVNLAVKENIDLTIPGTNFVTLYQGLFYDKLKARDLELARQEWIAGSNKSNNASNPDGKSGKKDPTPTNVNTMAEFDSLLQSIPNK